MKRNFHKNRKKTGFAGLRLLFTCAGIVSCAHLPFIAQTKTPGKRDGKTLSCFSASSQKKPKFGGSRDSLLSNKAKAEKLLPSSHPVESRIKIPLPEHLSPAFWKKLTYQQLEKKLKHIKNINGQRPDNDQSMLHLLLSHGRHAGMIPLLVSSGLDVRLKDKRSDGSSARALIYAAGRSQAFLEEMLKHDTEINEPGLLFYRGRIYMTNPLMTAVYRRLPSKLARRLLAMGADPNLNYQGFFALMLAVVPNEYGPPDFDTAHALLDGGADKSLKSAEGKTAFDYLTEHAQKNRLGQKTQKAKLRTNKLKALLGRLKP